MHTVSAIELIFKKIESVAMKWESIMIVNLWKPLPKSLSAQSA